MWKTRISLLWIASILFPIVSDAQLSATLRLAKREHVAGEPVRAEVTVTNNAGKDLVLHSDGRVQWLTLTVRDRRGVLVPARSRKLFGPMKIKAGTTMGREVLLDEHFLLEKPGNYTVSAVVRQPGSDLEAGATDRVPFNQSPGNRIWSQRVGVLGGAAIREYRLLSHGGDSKNQLYAQVLDGSSGSNVRTFLLGEVLMLRRPMAVVDGKQRLHVLFLATPSVWVHCEIDSDGRLVSRRLYLRPEQGDPVLVHGKGGAVSVANGIPYDPKAAAKQQQKTRKASDRPF